MGGAYGFVFQKTGLPSVEPGADPETLVTTPWDTDAEAEAACDAYQAELNTEWAARWEGDHYGDVFRHRDSPNPYRGCVWNWDMPELSPPAGAMLQYVQDDIWLDGPGVTSIRTAKASRKPADETPLGTTVSARKAAAMMRKPRKRSTTTKK